MTIIPLEWNAIYKNALKEPNYDGFKPAWSQMYQILNRRRQENINCDILLSEADKAAMWKGENQ